MSLQFYKPNPKATGTACSFWHNQEDNTFWVSLIKQDGWNSKTRSGSFSKNKNNPKKRVIVKFSDTEVCGLIDAINRNAEYSGYHSSQQIVKFKFCPYLKNGEQLGFSFSVQREAKEDSTDKQNYLMGFYFPEAEKLKLYLQKMMHDSFLILDKKFTPNTSNNKTEESTSNEGDEYDF